MVTVWLQVLLRPQQSVACQVRLMTHGQVPLVMVLWIVMVTLVPQQRSEALGGSKFQLEPHSTVLLLAQVMVGGMVSTMVTTRVQALVWPLQSVASQASVMTHGHAPLV